MAVPRPNIQWRGAHPNNFTVGRPGAGRDGRNTFHHIVGSAESAVALFLGGSRQVSSHLVITDRADVAAWQCVDFNNTAYCDGNWDSNLRTISMEHHGDWRNGYRNEQVIENSARVVAWLRDQGLVSRPIRHRDVSQSPTACPSDLVVEEIWNRSSNYIAQANTPPQAEWLKNRKVVTPYTVYSQKGGLYLLNLSDPNQILDSRRFALNQNFLIGSETMVGGTKYLITKSSTDANLAGGMRAGEVATTPYVPPVPQPIPIPPQPTTPKWEDSVIDDVNREMYVLRATPLINLTTGSPAKDKSGKDIWYQAGDIIKDVSAHAIVSEVTYQLTQYSLSLVQAGKPGSANGIKSSDLSIDASATPPGTPANPTPAPEPEDPIPPMPDVPTPPVVDRNMVVVFLLGLVKIIQEFIGKITK